MSAPRRAVVFDLDRTLVDLDVDIERVRAEVAAVFAPRGFTGRFAPILPCIDEAARAVAAHPGEVDAWIAAARAVIDRAERDAAGRARVRPGAREIVAELTARGTPLGVVTDNGRACVDLALAQLGVRVADTFGAVVTRDDVPAPKPDPGGVVTAARALLPRGGSLYYIGDSVRDLAAVRAARRELTVAVARGGPVPIDAFAIAVTGGASDLHALASAAPDAMAADLWAVLDILLMS